MSSQKLTKKQKKALAFRDRKGKGKATSQDDNLALDLGGDPEDAGGNYFPVEEVQELVGLQDDDVGRSSQSVQAILPPKIHEKEKGKGKGTSGGGGGKKRKREESEKEEGEQGGQGEGEEKQRKKKKEAGVEVGAVGEGGDAKGKGKAIKQRLILFVGNLKYTTSLDAIKEHFSACDPPPTVRLLTPKHTKSGSISTPKSKGCAFLEFVTKAPLQQALKLHHSTLEGRQINVELTAGGGGKSDTRLTKLKVRNKELDAQRKKRLEKQKANGEDVSTDLSQRPQRFSSTSGADQIPQGKHTWTVGDVDDGETHRGGQRHAKKKRGERKPKFEATGVNAIPVG
ncbi:hypothetical protein JAAARDRAFT_29369 [Jaapia argillacea MUCL 33604]|uniref:RRM domain-containing protein n=1 Tax=Jaapia argillacea MUCL 33604 TaxID=933084 RepID=A0A067QIK0_9AGAM|nr:hypothetical protein JAAARDRAFT_29369 [Jaapia argillacea MUCL 33604]